jgi:oligosaccharyltransferase complex subunit epsilon
MPPKQRTTAQSSTPSAPAAKPKPGSGSPYDAQDIVLGIWSKYVEKTPQRVKLLDTFLAFLIAVGALQFLYVVIVGNFVSNPHHTSPIEPSQLQSDVVWRCVLMNTTAF